MRSCLRQAADLEEANLRSLKRLQLTETLFHQPKSYPKQQKMCHLSKPSAVTQFLFGLLPRPDTVEASKHTHASAKNFP